MRTASVLAALALTAACSPSSPLDPTDVPDQARSPAESTTVTVAIGQTTTVGRLTLVLVEVPEDSRCAVDVTCVWAGDATVVIHTVVGGVERVLALHLNPQGEDVRSVRVDGYTITLVALDPAARSDRRIPPAEYRATFRVTGA